MDIPTSHLTVRSVKNRFGISTGHRSIRMYSLSVAAILTLGFATLGSDLEPAFASSSASNILTSPADSSVKGTVTIWDRSGDLYTVFDATIAAFEQKFPNIKVNHQAVDISAKLQNTLISGVGVPDGVFLDDSLVAGDSPFLWDLSHLLAPYTRNIAQQKLDVNSQNGGLYGVPFDLDPGLLFYNAAVLKKDGINPLTIKTYTDLLVAARIVKKANPTSGPIHLEQSAFLGQLWLEMFSSQIGTSMTDAKGKLRLDSPQYRTILNWLDQVRKENLGTRAEYFSPTHLAALDSGKEVFVPWAQWFDYGPENLLKTTKGDWRAMPLPAWTPGGARSGAMGGSSFVIPKGAKNPQAAWVFYKYLMFNKAGYSAVWGPNSVYPNGTDTSIPSYTIAANPYRPLFGPSDALGNQNLWKVATLTARHIPGGSPTPTWWAGAVSYLGNNLQKMLDGRMTPEQVIQQSSKDIQSNLVNRQ